MVGLLTDDGLPRQLAGTIADELPARLARDLGEETSWRVEHETQFLPLNDNGDIPMSALAEERRAERGGDLLVLITDLPRRAGTVPIASDYNADHGAGRPAPAPPGAPADRPPGPAPGGAPLGEGARPAAADARPAAGARGADEHVALVGVRGRLRLLAGMIRDNRPWWLVPNLAGATAAAAATRRVRHHHHLVLAARRSPARPAAGRDHAPGDRGHGGLADGAQPPLGLAIGTLGAPESAAVQRFDGPYPVDRADRRHLLRRGARPPGRAGHVPEGGVAGHFGGLERRRRGTGAPGHLQPARAAKSSGDG